MLKQRVCIPILVLLSSLLNASGTTGHYPVEPVPFTRVRITGDFWKTRLDTHYRHTIAHVLEQCETTGRLNNFKIAAGLAEGKFQGNFFNDSDVYKILEGMAYSLTGPMSVEHKTFLDNFIKIMEKAQMDDGYLYTFYQVKNELGKQWSNIAHMHELYCAGHMIEAGVAHYQATGKKDLLNIVTRFADKIDMMFGEGKRTDPPGHQELELALVKLYRATGENRYLALAKFLLDQRGRHGNWYDQNHIPLVKQKEAVGHAVRAVYGYSGMTDIAALTGGTQYGEAVRRLWNNVVGKKMALSGGIGGGLWEAFDKEYFLPNRSSYNETCGSIAMVLWNHRMFLLTKDAKYLDVLERALYNGTLTGVALDGQSFYYPNPLESGGGMRRPWFGCACCPSNIARIIPALPGYIYACSDDTLFVNLFVSSTAKFDLEGTQIQITQKTSYPWSGKVTIKVRPEKNRSFTLAVRIPGWTQNKPVPSDLYRYLTHSDQKAALDVNGTPVPCTPVKGFVQVKRQWKKNDTLTLTMPMTARRVIAHDKVKDDRGLVALERGPIVYCAEGIDNPNAKGKVWNIRIPDDAGLTAVHKKELLQNTTIITGDAKLVLRGEDGKSLEQKDCQLTAVPYFARANRKSTPMAVWLLRDPRRAVLPPVPSPATKSTVTASTGKGNFGALRDQIEPARSADASRGVFAWSGRTGTTEWVQYEFKKTETISRSKVYWYDRFGTIERRPKSWRLLYKAEDKWIPVTNNDPYEVAIDRYSCVGFDPVTTTAIRLEAKLQDAFLDPYLALPNTQPAKFSAGILEWAVE